MIDAAGRTGGGPDSGIASLLCRRGGRAPSLDVGKLIGKSFVRHTVELGKVSVASCTDVDELRVRARRAAVEVLLTVFLDEMHIASSAGTDLGPLRSAHARVNAFAPKYCIELNISRISRVLPKVPPGKRLSALRADIHPLWIRFRAYIENPSKL